MEKIIKSAIAAVRNQELGQIHELEQNCAKVYNYFVHNPIELLKNDSPYIIGEVFFYYGAFNEPDMDINEVKGENAYISFSRCLQLRNSEEEQDIVNCKFAAAKLLIYISVRPHYFTSLFQEVASEASGSDKQSHNCINYVRVFLLSILKGNQNINISLSQAENQNLNLIVQDIQQKNDISDATIKEGEFLHEVVVSEITEKIKMYSNPRNIFL